jgi:4-amino-4-deoxy-L-arabinose transferase-like glycosyltransferase
MKKISETFSPKKHIHTLLLMGIILLSSVFVFGGANWGLPTLLHPDERVIVEPAIRMVQNRTFEPDVFYRPDHLLIQINSLIYRVIVFLHGLPAESITNIGVEIFYLTARVVTGIFAIGSTILSYLIGRRYSNLVGVICAFIFAFFPRYITHSHYVTPDVPTVFFMLLFIYVALNYMQKSNIVNVVLMALVTAGFILIKYPGAILCIMIAVSIILKGLKEKQYLRIVKHGASAIVLIIAFIFLISPALLLNFSQVQQALINEARTIHLGADGLGMGGNMLFYFNNYLSASGLILLIFFFIGCYALVSQKQSALENIPLFYGLIFWVSLSAVSLHWERWGLPMHVTPLLISAIGISKAYDLIKENRVFINKQKLATSIFIGLLCISALNLVSTSYGYLLNATVQDTRVASQRYVQENNINIRNSVFEGYTTLNPTNPGMIFEAFEERDGVFYLRDNHIENIILSSFMYDRFKAEPVRYSGQVAFYQFIDENLAEVASFYTIPRNSSIVEVINIYHNVSYIFRVKNHGMVGPTLIFYQVEF